MDEKPSLQAMEEEAKIALARLKKFELQEGWVLFDENPCKMFYLDVQERIVSKSEAIVNFPFEEVVTFLADILNLKKINPKCS